MKGLTFMLVAAHFTNFVPTVAYPFVDKLVSEADKTNFDTLKRNLNKVSNTYARDIDQVAGPNLEPRVIGPRKANGLLDLPLGGGLLNGVLQPLTGSLKNLRLPTPQIINLKEIPGDDPDHQFQPPGPTDVRGVCPTLNTLANHGYLDRSGITNFAEAANAIQIAYSNSYDVAVFLSALGLLAGGDLLTGIYSIGGADPRVPNTLGPAPGIDRHGNFELDGSISRQDIYFGNNANFLLKRWQGYVDTAKRVSNGQFDFKMQAVNLGDMYDLSRSRNPEFVAGPLWFVGGQAERAFVTALLGNGTKPGVVDYASVSPFFLSERFPNNWYRRAEAYTLPQTIIDGLLIYSMNPRPLGANQGSGNFVALDLDLGSKTPSELGCLLARFILDVTPGQIAAGFFKGVVAPFFSDDSFFNCPTDTFTAPGKNAGIDKYGSVSSSGSPVNGSYPGIGVIDPDY